MNETISYTDFIKAIKTGEIPEYPLMSENKCHVTTVLVMLQGKWKNHVLFEMCKHEMIRFGELKKALPAITNTMLTATLRELETENLINREQFNEIPPRVEYRLTSKGQDLMPIFYEMMVWGNKHLEK